MQQQHFYRCLSLTIVCCFALDTRFHRVFSQEPIATVVESPSALDAPTAVDAPTVPDSPTVDFVKDIAPLFERRCAGCHAGDRAKAGFEIDDREAVMSFIEAGDTENSSLWSDYLNVASAHAASDTLVMPLSGPLSKNELTVLNTWIQEGANWPAAARFIKTAGIPVVDREPDGSEGLLQRLSAFIGYFHPAIVHFPIALLIFGGAAAALSFVTGGRAVYVAFYCLLWGALFTAVATFTGWSLAAEKGYPAWSSIPTSESVEAASAVFRHRWLGTFACVGSFVVLCTAIFAARNPTSKCRNIWRISFIVLALVVSIVGHQGGELVYGDIIGKAFERLVGK